MAYNVQVLLQFLGIVPRQLTNVSLIELITLNKIQMQNLHSSARTAAKIMFRSWGLIRQAKIATILMLYAVLASSCGDYNGYKRAYIISKSDDNNWTTSGIIECDSFTMVSNNEVVFYVDGRKATMKGQIIKCLSNKNYAPVK